MDHILYQIFKIKYFIQTHEEVKDNPPIKIEKRIKFRTKTEYYLELLTPETKKSLGRTKSKINLKMKMVRMYLI